MIIPKENFPRPFKQGFIGCCAAATLTRILEVWVNKALGEYKSLSVGYTYGRNNYPGKKQEGMSLSYTVPLMCNERGTVPEELCPILDEIPEIIQKLNALPNILELDEIATHIKFKSFEKLLTKNTIEMLEKAKKFLDEYQMPIVGEYDKGSMYHAVIVVGYDGEKLCCIDHDGTLDIQKIDRKRFRNCYSVIGDIEEIKKYYKKEDDNLYQLIKLEEISNYISNVKSNRNIKSIQLHHTAAPTTKDFNGSNQLKMQQSMANYHKSKGYIDIAQHFTVFPDGSVMTGRSLDKDPAGIYGANSNAICIECIGNFDSETLTDKEKNGIITLVRGLMSRFNIGTDKIVYHCWYTSKGVYLGDYVKGKSCKTCPGANFFGGNTNKAFSENLKPLLGDNKLKAVVSINDIIWELLNAKVITDAKLWTAKCNEDKNIYWLCYKMANKLRGVL